MRALYAVLLALPIAGCYESHRFGLGAEVDAGGAPDASGADDAGRRRDAGRFDGTRDGAPDDAGRFDAGRFDAGRFDAALPDGGVPPDAGPFDGGGPARPALRISERTFFGFPDEGAYDLPDDATFELWVRTRARGSHDYCGKGDATPRDLIIGQRDDHFAVGWEYTGIEHMAISRTPLVPDRWTHLAMVRRAGADGRHRLLLYVDGVLAATELEVPNAAAVFNDQPLRCGFTDADVDELRLWRMARSDADIAAHRSMRISGATAGLVAYWRLDERGQILTDYTATGHAGILGRRVRADAEDAVWITDGAL